MRVWASVDLPTWRAPVMSATGKSARDRSTRCWRCRLSMVDILPSHGGFSRHCRTLLRLAQRQPPPSFRPHKRLHCRETPRVIVALANRFESKDFMLSHFCCAPQLSFACVEGSGLGDTSGAPPQAPAARQTDCRPSRGVFRITGRAGGHLPNSGPRCPTGRSRMQRGWLGRDRRARTRRP